MPPIVPLPGFVIRTEYEEVDARTLQSESARFVGHRVRIEGIVASIERRPAGTFLQIRMDADDRVLPSSAILDAAVFAALPDIGAGDRVAIYGVIDRNLAGAQATLSPALQSPLLAIDYIDLL